MTGTGSIVIALRGPGSQRGTVFQWLGLCAAVLLLFATFVFVAEQSASAATGGTKLWVSRYNGPGNAVDGAFSFAVSPDGSKVFVTGKSWGTSTSDDYATVAYDPSTGARLWVKRYSGHGNNEDFAFSVAVSPDGSKVFVTGYSIGHTGYDYATVAYRSSSGAELWISRYNPRAHGDDYAASLAVSPDGSKVFVTGQSAGSMGGQDYATIAYESSTGAQLWARRYNGPANGDDYGETVAVSPDGSKVFVTGSSDGKTTLRDYATVAYDPSTGIKLWVRRYNDAANGVDETSSMAVSPDGSKVFVTGLGGGATGGFDYATVTYDASTGAVLWVKRYNGPGDRDDGANSLAVSPDGSAVFITGFSFGTTTHADYATVAYDPSTGARLWVKRYNGPGDTADVARSLAVSPDGSKVFVTGGSDGIGTGPDYATVAYDPSTGTRLWVKRYNDPASRDDQAYSVGVSPDGSKVFVTGFSIGTTSYDYATVAYVA
jgi:DNA-binding beta-propeller fold protein YncE